jgi:hypothetical protein
VKRKSEYRIGLHKHSLTKERADPTSSLRFCGDLREFAVEGKGEDLKDHGKVFRIRLTETKQRGTGNSAPDYRISHNSDLAFCKSLSAIDSLSNKADLLGSRLVALLDSCKSPRVVQITPQTLGGKPPSTSPLSPVFPPSFPPAILYLLTCTYSLNGGKGGNFKGKSSYKRNREGERRKQRGEYESRPQAQFPPDTPSDLHFVTGGSGGKLFVSPSSPLTCTNRGGFTGSSPPLPGGNSLSATPRPSCPLRECPRVLKWEPLSTRGDQERPMYPERLCGFPACDNLHRTNGLCMAHHLQRLQGVPLTELRVRTPKHTGCSVYSCTNKHYSRGYCQKHYAQWRRGKRAQ